MNFYKLLLPAVALAATAPFTLAACGQTKADHTAAATPDTARVTESILMPLPEVPDSIFDPLERADYIVLHYWDSLPPDDPRGIDRKFMEANFRQYAEQFNFASDAGAAYAVAVLIDQTQAYPDHLKMLADMAVKHFGGRGSDTFSDRSLIIWLKELTSTESIDEGMRSKYGFLLEAASRNAPGTKAADIRFSRRGGQVTSLYNLSPAPYTLLVLYDPECETCHETIERVRTDKRLMQPVERGQVRVVMIDVADNRSAFEYDNTPYPAPWIVGYDESRIEDNDIYIFEQTPTFYLLDRDLKVLLKDATVDDLVQYARTAAPH